jgi:tRNA nucleotidyltransferase/poly(A) polymerase
MVSKFITVVPKDKIINELEKISNEQNPLPAIYMLNDTNLLKVISQDTNIKRILQNKFHAIFYKHNKI